MREHPPAPVVPLGVYVHFPFCSVRCSYCDFPTVAGRDETIGAYLGALEREISTQQTDAPHRVDSIFLGGGTPSRMSPDQLSRVLDALARRFDIAPESEITIEANPESLDATKVRAYLQCGVTRISVGVQSLDERALRLAHRPHGVTDSLHVLRGLRGIDNLEVNADLIVGLPGESLTRWGARMRRVAELNTDHLSLYLLETDKQAPLARAVRAGRTKLVDDDRLVDCYREAVGVFAETGLVQYEISNFARRGRSSRHNLKYWTDAWYLGYGLGAHGYRHGYRRANVRDLDAYIRALSANRDPVCEIDPWHPGRRVEEALFMGLRLVAGLDLDALGQRYEIDLWRAYEPVWQRSIDRGLLVREGASLRLTERGRLCSNAVFVDLLGDSPEPSATRAVADSLCHNAKFQG